MHKVASAIANLTGWPRALSGILAGAVSVLAFAPFHFWFVLFLTVPVFVWLIDGRIANIENTMLRAKLAARTGWQFGFGFFVAGLYWIGASFLVEADTFAWLMPLAVLGLPAGLALLFGAGTGLAGILWRPGLARLVGLALGIGLAELLRGYLFTGLPWNTIGYALTASDEMMQWASLVGVYSLSFLAIAIFSAPAAVWQPGNRPFSPAAGLVYMLTMVGILGAGWAWGKHRLQHATLSTVPDVRLRIVQPNIPQNEKWIPENAPRIFQTYLQVSSDGPPDARPGLEGITHLVWPESALPFLLADTTEALVAIADLLPEKTVLLTGQARAEEVLRADGSLKKRHIYNSLFVMNGRARILRFYDKLHLVPFGEFLPFQGVLEAIGLEQLTRIQGGFAPGEGTRALSAPGIPDLVPLICYEVIFPHAIRLPDTNPGWMLNVTNDAWFGNTLGPYQHLHQARVRAVEQGLPMVRAANTGISAIIDPYGRISASLPLGKRGTLDTRLPAKLPETVFSRSGFLFELLFSFSFALFWLMLICTQKRLFSNRF